MPKSRSRGKAMRAVPRHVADLKTMNTETRDAAPTVAIHKPALDPVKITKPTGMSWRKKTGIFAASSAAVGGTAYLAHHYSRRNTVTKLYDPFTDSTVEFAKDRDQGAGAGIGAAIGRKKPVKKMYDPFIGDDAIIEKDAQGFSISNVRYIKALVPTGRNVSHANKVHFTSHGRRTRSTSQQLTHIKH